MLTLFCPIMLVMFAAGTITSDKAEHGWKALFVFPFSRRQYVLEKYVLILLASLPFTAIATFETIVLWKLDEALLTTNIAVLLLFTAFSVPTLLFFSPSAAQNFLAGYFVVFSVGGSVLLTSDLSIFFMQIPFVLSTIGVARQILLVGNVRYFYTHLEEKRTLFCTASLYFGFRSILFYFFLFKKSRLVKNGF